MKHQNFRCAERSFLSQYHQYMYAKTQPELEKYLQACIYLVVIRDIRYFSKNIKW